MSIVSKDDFNSSLVNNCASWAQDDSGAFIRTKTRQDGSLFTTTYHVGSFLESGCGGKVFDLIPSDPMRKTKVIKCITQQYSFQHSTEALYAREKQALDVLKKSCPSFAGYVKSTDIPNAIIFRKLDSTLLERLGSLSFWEKISIIDQLDKQLDQMHQAGILHGDIHPGNMMCRKKDNQFHFIDFGSSFIREENISAFDTWCSNEKNSFILLMLALLKDHLRNEDPSDIDGAMLEAAKKYDPTFRVHQIFKHFSDNSDDEHAVSDSDEKSLIGPDSPSTPCCCQIL